MRGALLPLFPLNVVLFPRTFLPLHIFEERYKEMMGDLLVSGGEFGVVLARGNGIVSTGCTATIEKVLERYDDGKLDIMTLGRRRFEVAVVNVEKPYLRAEVDSFEDHGEELAPPAVRTAVLRDFFLLKNLQSGVVIGEPSVDDPELSFQVAQILDDLDFRQRLLQLRSESARLRLLAEFLPKAIEKQQRIEHVRKIAPRNGHTKLPASFSA
jgi:Lon protease-like protein